MIEGGRSGLNKAIGSLVDSLSRVAPEMDWESVTDLLYYGEEGEAMDVLVAIVVRFNVPVTNAVRQRMSEIMTDFGFPPESRSTYRYASDHEMLDRMTVVDESS